MRALRERAVHGVLGALGALFGILAAIGLLVAAFVPALLGLLAFMLSPLRAMYERLRGPQPGGRGG